MKLQEFFNTQKDIHLTDIDKLDLYQSFLYKKAKKPLLRRTSFIHAKYFVYTTVFAILIMGTYGIYFMNNDNIQDYKRFSIKSNNTNTVQAEYIAQVIDVKGNFSIERNGILTTTNNIGNGDTILLKEDTQLVFEINSGTQSKIIGPAKLVIQKTDINDYKLNLIYGDFIQVEGKKEKTQTIELAINDITIKQEDKSQPLNFKFVKNGQNQVFQNNGANIIVSKNNGKENTKTITKEQVVAIQNNDIKIFANINNFTTAVQEKNISQTFSLITEETTSSWSDKEETTLLSLLNTPQIIESKEEITKNIASVLTDEKQILDPSEDEKVNANLYAQFYIAELEELEASFIAGNNKSFDIAYAKLEKRINNIYQIFTIIYTTTSGEPLKKMEGLNSAINILQTNINNKYSVPPKYIESLQSIENTIKNIINKWYGSAAPMHEVATDEINIQK
jgi:hypothetical protein